MLDDAPTRQQRRKLRTSAAILDAAQALFLERGYPGTTVEQIAERADVALGSLYGHFAGKAGVYAALVDRSVLLVKRFVDEGWESGSGPIGHLLGLSDGYLRFAREHPGLFRFFRFPPPGGPTDGPAIAAGERVARRVADEIERMSGAIAEGISAGLAPGPAERAAWGIDREIDPRAVAIFLWAAWDGIIAAHLLPGNMALDDDEFERVLQVARTVILRGLLAPQAPLVQPASAPASATASPLASATETASLHPTEPGESP
jgi:TetR/AcrR family transcriptional regulator